jgi:hypothetical protein
MLTPAETLSRFRLCLRPLSAKERRVEAICRALQRSQAGKTYDFKVIGRNSLGEGPESAVKSIDAA